MSKQLNKEVVQIVMEDMQKLLNNEDLSIFETKEELKEDVVFYLDTAFAKIYRVLMNSEKLDKNQLKSCSNAILSINTLLKLLPDV